MKCLNPLKSGQNCNGVQPSGKHRWLPSVSIPLNRVRIATKIQFSENVILEYCLNPLKSGQNCNQPVFKVTKSSYGLNPLKSGQNCNWHGMNGANDEWPQSLNPLKSGQNCNFLLPQGMIKIINNKVSIPLNRVRIATEGGIKCEENQF